MINQIEGALGYEIVLPTFRKLTSALGVQRVLFGSDFTYNMQEMIQIVKSADFLSESDKEKVLGGNAKKVLKI